MVIYLVIIAGGIEGHVNIYRHVLLTTASGNVASMREPLDGSLWWYWIAANAAKKNGASFKNYHRRPSS